MNKTDRKRVVLACDSCRKRKRKCDGVEPVCGQCLKVGAICCYNRKTDGRVPPSRAYLNAIRRKLEILENKVKRYEEILGVNTESTAVSTDILHVVSGDEIDSRSPESLDETQAESENDKFDKYTRLNLGEDGQMRSYGPRSAMSFPSQKLDLFRIPGWKIRVDAYADAALQGKTFTISDELRDELLELFFTFQNSSVMFVSRTVFERHMDSHGSCFSLALLSAMLAIGARFSDRPETWDPKSQSPGTAGMAYADLAKFLLHYEEAAPNITTVQTCGLLCIFYIMTDQEVLAWNFSGMATKFAFVTGINMEYKSIGGPANEISEEEDEVRRITWWACYVLEKLVSNCIGRPVSIKKYNITAGLPGNEYIEELGFFYNRHIAESKPETAKLLADRSCRYLSLTQFMIELYMTCDEPLNQIYLAFRPQPQSETVKVIDVCDLELIEFERGLPIFLRFSQSRPSQQLPHVYSLHLRFHQVRILMHRVMFIRINKPVVSIDEEDRYQKTCRTSANAICKIIKEFDILYGWKYLDFVAPDSITAAAIVHMYLLRAPYPDIVGTAQRNYALCVACLKSIVQRNLMARRFLRVLELLAEDWNVAV